MAKPPLRSERKVRRGYVVSDKMDKTVVVRIEDRVEARPLRQGHAQEQEVKVHDEHNGNAASISSSSWRPARCRPQRRVNGNPPEKGSDLRSQTEIRSARLE